MNEDRTRTDQWRESDTAGSPPVRHELNPPSNVGPAAELWGNLYGLLCKFRPVQHGLGAISDDDAVRLDDLAEKIIKDSGAFGQQTPGA